MKIDNILKLYFILLKGRRKTANELANELCVSIRTVLRYIDILSTNNIPIISFYGKEGGYELDSDYIKRMKII